MFILQIRYHHTYQESANNKLVLRKNDTSQLELHFLCTAQRPLVGQGLLIIEASRSHSGTPHSIGPSGGVISPSQRLLPDNKQHSRETDIHASGGVLTGDSSKRAAAGPRLRPRGHWERPRTFLRS